MMAIDGVVDLHPGIAGTHKQNDSTCQSGAAHDFLPGNVVPMSQHARGATHRTKEPQRKNEG